jgi:hypothetical protein
MFNDFQFYWNFFCKQTLMILCFKDTLINSMILLRDLKRADARRGAQLMAIALNKLRNAADVRFRSRPPGLAGLSVLGVMPFRQVFNLPSKSCLDHEQACKPEAS